MKRAEVKLDPHGNGVAAALIMEGLIPSMSMSPTITINIRVVKAYRVIHVQCPHLAVQAFVKSLCNIHRVPYRPYLCQQFSIAYDLYLDLCRHTEERMMKVLGCNSSWRLKHAFPVCTYKLEGEDAIIFEMLITMDRNNSLKHVLQREKVMSEMGEPVLGKSREHVDNGDAGDGYYLQRERVERWVRDRVADRLPMEPMGEDNPCADHWKNMINDVPSKMWGIFDKTGIFLALCCHRFILVLADMIKSRELAKYPLAVVEELLDAFEMKLGIGYDGGCHFGATVANSKLGNEAQEKQLKCLVGSFHGHTHNCLCQLQFLVTYVEGMGLEDLEGCECFFSRSNGLAKSCHYASCKFLCSNYHQALGILKIKALLRAWMHQEGVESVDRFTEWLAEETTYLEGLKSAPKTNNETLEMEYVQKLVNLSASQRHVQEKMEKDLERMQELEELLEIEERWITVSSKWTATVNEIKKRKYHLTLDVLELLIVERIFELTKMNQSQTGYKMCKHIAKALQARSKAVKNAIERYNDVAAALDLPMRSVSWEQVVEYAFVVDFDILRETCAETLKAREEIKRLNIEICWVITWIRDENCFLWRMERSMRAIKGETEEQIEVDTLMAVQVRLYRKQQGPFDAGHLENFWKLAQMPGFTGSL
ncbi:hypothetical protein DFH08DRAFT_912373 [Mycena albidolilacea]|uniref:Uncharacterized protein n=1 Tax=Mycena albidolilacea TaxID=1033008 RepID=A0AAD7EX91_9AGAR|nr:hypothetical protein DFH08DRAFT_912373 [Mycena albidolilacea]